MKIAMRAGGVNMWWSSPIPDEVQVVFALPGVSTWTMMNAEYLPIRENTGSVVITRRGHYYASWDGRDELHNDDVCRGCGHHGHFDHILDYVPCAVPATAKRIRKVLQERV